MFHPGQPIVCVDDSHLNDYGVREIIAGHIYTVRAMVDPDPLLASMNRRPIDEPGVLLVEVTRQFYPDLGEIPFGAGRFRPLDQSELEVVIPERVPA